MIPRSVPMYQDGMDLERLEVWDGNVCAETNGSHLKIDDWKTTFLLS